MRSRPGGARVHSADWDRRLRWRKRWSRSSLLCCGQAVQLGVIAALADAGVVDTDIALSGCAQYGRDASVRVLLQHQAGRATSKDKPPPRSRWAGSWVLTACWQGVTAVHAVSWLWPSDAPVVDRAAEDARKADTASSPLTRMLPILRRRNGAARRVLLRELFRWVAICSFHAVTLHAKSQEEHLCFAMPPVLFFRRIATTPSPARQL